MKTAAGSWICSLQARSPPRRPSACSTRSTRARVPPRASAESAIKGDPEPLIAALPKYLYVKVLAANRDNVNVKIPIVLVRSGLKLTSLIPPLAMDKINETMTAHGMSVDFNNFKPEDIDELIGALRETEVNVDTENGDTVRVYCA